MTNPPFTLHWGILGAGDISGAFVKDILLDPKTFVFFLSLIHW
jgi:hypothetical protein